jgi:hypothetical protein
VNRFKLLNLLHFFRPFGTQLVNIFGSVQARRFLETGASLDEVRTATVLGKITVGGKYAAHDPNATDGTETAVAVLWSTADASAGDAPAVALVRGPAIVNRHDLVFAGPPSESEIAAAHAALAVAGILVR